MSGVREPSDGARFDAALDALRAGIAARVTPGAQLSVRYRAHGMWHSVDFAVGTLSYEVGSSPVRTDTPYDLASVTKALVALSLVRFATREGLDLRSTVASIDPNARGTASAECTLEALCAHRSGLPAWRPFFEAVRARDAQREDPAVWASVLRAVRAVARETDGSTAVYSDVGYIVLGEAIAAAARVSLRNLVAREITLPLLLGQTIAYRGSSPAWTSGRVAPTEQCAWRGELVRGRVHDENAFSLGGAAGHAGCFGTAGALAEVGRVSLDALAGNGAWFDPGAMRAMVEPREGGSHRLGWDGRSKGKSSAGALSHERTFGHLGFTGTSLWCDPSRETCVALLTNRVHPTREREGIFGLRSAVHDAVWRAVDAERAR